MSDTLRTDAECGVGFDGCTNITKVDAVFARQLERELSDANDHKHAVELALRFTEKQLSDAKAERDDYRKALEQIANTEYTAIAALDARAVLAKYKETP